MEGFLFYQTIYKKKLYEKNCKVKPVRYPFWLIILIQVYTKKVNPK